MKHICFSYGGLLFACAVFAGCSGGASLPVQGGNTTASSAAMRMLSMTMAHYVQPAVHADHGQSWMLPQKKGAKAALLYSGDDENDEVYVYDYKSGKPVGTLTGFDGPYGMCVDAKGDVYITNFDAEDAVEYAHGGTTILNTYEVSDGAPIGCSVDSKRDVAVTSFDPGEVEVFAGGDPSKGTVYSDSACYYLWTMGYDSSGNLVGVGENEDGDRGYCALLSGGSSMTTLSYSGTIDFPGGTMWDGKYIALTDQEANGEYETGITEASLSGSTLTSHGEAILTCGESETADMVNPFIVGKKNTPVNDRQGKVVVGPGCGSDGIGFWHYPKGGDPFKSYGDSSEYGAAVSLGT